MLSVVSIFSGLPLNSSGFVDFGGRGSLDHVPTAESTLLKSPTIIVL